MEPKYKSKGISNELTESGTKDDTEIGLAVSNKRSKVREWDLFLRVAAVVLSLAAAVVLGLDKQITKVWVTPAVSVPVTAKWQYQSALVYSMSANVIACAYGATSLLVILANRGPRKIIATVIVFIDLVMVALLFSSIGASLAVGLISHEGNSHAHWHKVCSIIGKFCRQSSFALGLSGVASSVFFVLVFSAILLNIHKTN